MSTVRATWFCIDIECSGPVPAIFDMISLGAVVVHDHPDGSLTIGDTLYLELRPQGPRVDPGAMKVNGLDRREGLERLSAWVAEQRTPGSEPVFVGHNAPFDWSFVAWCYKAEELVNPFGYKALDTKAFSAGVLDLHWLDSGKPVLAERLGLPSEDQGLKHRADYDAQYQAEILKRLLEVQRGR